MDWSVLEDSRECMAQRETRDSEALKAPQDHWDYRCDLYGR